MVRKNGALNAAKTAPLGRLSVSIEISGLK